MTILKKGGTVILGLRIIMYSGDSSNHRRSRVIAVQLTGKVNNSYVITIPKQFAKLMHIDDTDAQVLVRLRQKSVNGAKYYCTIEKVDYDEDE